MKLFVIVKDAGWFGNFYTGIIIVNNILKFVRYESLNKSTLQKSAFRYLVFAESGVGFLPVTNFLPVKQYVEIHQKELRKNMRFQADQKTQIDRLLKSAHASRMWIYDKEKRQ